MSSDKERALREEVKKLREENKRLREEKEKIKKEFDKTKKEFEDYKANHVQTVVELRKALRIKQDKKKKQFRLGAPRGHKRLFASHS